MIALLEGTDVTGIELEGIKITRDPHYKRIYEAATKAPATTTNYKTYVNDDDYYNALLNPEGGV